MAGWLGSNFTAQLDQIKKGVNQVSSIVKDTLVVDETWDEDDPDLNYSSKQENGLQIPFCLCCCIAVVSRSYSLLKYWVVESLGVVGSCTV